MPVISRFYGITVRMFYEDHAPPHFHAEYQGKTVMIGLKPIKVLDGEAPERVTKLANE